MKNSKHKTLFNIFCDSELGLNWAKKNRVDTNFFYGQEARTTHEVLKSNRMIIQANLGNFTNPKV